MKRNFSLANRVPVRTVLEPAAQSRTFALIAGLVLITGLVAGCASLPVHPLLPSSYAEEGSPPTFLQVAAQRAVPDAALSGFQLMPVATNAYETRITLADTARRTLDVQYYVLASDDTGRVLMTALKNAALRGVRVRVLVDDGYTAGEDQLLGELAACPNVEVRLFNPFPAARGSILTRFAASGLDFGRVDHRMHNKLFIADDAFAVAGGRNIADEYFMRSRSDNFVDLDVLAAGNVVRELSTIFDTYWNSRFVYPLQTIVGATPDPVLAQQRFDADVADALAPPPDTDVPERLQRYAGTPDEILSGQLHLTLAMAHAFADPPAKAGGLFEKSRLGTVRATLAEAMADAHEDVFAISPYFIPGEAGMKTIRALRERGVTLRLLTNSLASTDEPLVHGAYAKTRLEMVRLGAQIYELSPTIAQRRHRLGRFGKTLGSLHAKIAVIDHRRLFVGSMNLDERSERKNTELGILIESPALAAELENMVDFKSSAYQVRLDPATGDLQWVNGEGADQVVLSDDPEAGFWLKLEVKLLSAFVPSTEL